MNELRARDLRTLAKRQAGIRVQRYFPPESNLVMKGLYSTQDLYGPARAVYLDGAYLNTDWNVLLRQIGDSRKRLWWIGDRILDRLEARLLRDQLDLPPGMLRLINQYRALFLLRPVSYTTSLLAHDGVLDLQARLVPRDPRPALRRRRKT